LKHLELRIKGYFDLAIGHLWQLLAKNLATLKFIVNVNLESIEDNFLDTFRTSFWLEEKRWFVAYADKYLYTVPSSMYTHVNELFQVPKYATVLKSSIFYDHVIKLTLYYELIETCHRFINITTLEIGFKDISVKILLTIVNLSKVKNLTLRSSMNKSKIKYLLNNSASLFYFFSLPIDDTTLTISKCHCSFFLYQVRELR
jgi:hypothetical protein